MKLKEWADKTGVKYLTAYRWFKDGTLPVPAYQTDSGTIIVEDDFDKTEHQMATPSQNDAMSLFLKKTVEYSKNNSTVEDFAAYILSNFTLNVNSPKIDNLKYSKNKPKSEDIQNHFKKFIPAKGEKPKPNMFIADEETLNEIGKTALSISDLDPMPTLESKTAVSLINGMSSLLSNSQSLSSEGTVNNLVDLSPQQINYTSSTNGSTFGSNFSGSMSSFGSATPSFYSAPEIDLQGSLNLSLPNSFFLTAKEIDNAKLVTQPDVKQKQKRGRPRKSNS